jgi:hypothetical protein
MSPPWGTFEISCGTKASYSIRLWKNSVLCRFYAVSSEVTLKNRPKMQVFGTAAYQISQNPAKTHGRTIVAPPSRRLSGGRLAGKMRALHREDNAAD